MNPAERLASVRDFYYIAFPAHTAAVSTSMAHGAHRAAPNITKFLAKIQATDNQIISRGQAAACSREQDGGISCCGSALRQPACSSGTAAPESKRALTEYAGRHRTQPERPEGRATGPTHSLSLSSSRSQVAGEARAQVDALLEVAAGLSTASAPDDKARLGTASAPER